MTQYPFHSVDSQLIASNAEQEITDIAPVPLSCPEKAAPSDKAFVIDSKAGRTPHHHEFLSLIQSMLTFLVSALFVLTFVAQPYRIPSASMKNTLLIGDFLLVNKVIFASSGPWRHLLAYEPIRLDDIIVFHYPLDHSMHLVKRVIGVPGARIHLHNGRVYVNGHELSEPYAIYISSYPNPFRDEFPAPVYNDPGVSTRWWMEMNRDVRDGELVVPPGKYFVLGDNRNDSLDSRYWGFVPRSNIVGEPFLVYFSVSSDRPEILGTTSDRLAHEHSWWSDLTSVARWDRIFHIIR